MQFILTDPATRRWWQWQMMEITDCYGWQQNAQYQNFLRTIFSKFQNEVPHNTPTFWSNSRLILTKNCWNFSSIYSVRDFSCKQLMIIINYTNYIPWVEWLVNVRCRRRVFTESPIISNCTLICVHKAIWPWIYIHSVL